jgi:hypothetical protein
MPYGTINVDRVVDTSGGILAPISSVFRNRIINGAMVIDQRNAGASVTPIDGQYSLDRWRAALTQASKFTIQQNAGSVTLPTGFKNYLGATSSSAYSLGAGDIFSINQRIEGYNIADLGWGTANAKTVTLSFQVYSSLTGTFGGSLFNSDGSRNYPFSYTVSSANTWTSISVTIAGDTSGTWQSTNSTGIQVNFSLGAGSTYSGTAGSWGSTLYYSATGAVSVVGTNGATFYITGVQLEKGSTATSFDYRPYGTELALCQRYFQTYRGADNAVCVGVMNTSTNFIGVVTYVVEMRAAPTLSATSGSDYFRVYTTDGRNPSTVSANDLIGSKAMSFNATVPSGLTAGQAGYFRCFNASAQINYSAEL